MNRVKDMTRGEPARLILMFALPLILGNLGQQLYMIVDAIIVGRGVGVDAFASLGATDWTYWLILWTVQGLTQGFSILIAHHFGAGDYQRLKNAICTSILLCVIIGTLLTLAGLAMAGPLLTVLKTPDNIMNGARSYLMTMYAGTLIVMGYNMSSAILRSFGDGRTPLIAMVIAAGTNIVLDLLFVMIFHWGIVGAAVATLLAQLVSLIYCAFSIAKMDTLTFELSDWGIQKETVRTLCRLGLAPGAQHLLIAIGGMILQSVINGYGFLFVAGFTATNKIYGLLESSAISFGYATTTYVAQNFGADGHDRIKTGVHRAALLAFTVSVLISFVMILFGRNILALFISSGDPNAAEVLSIAYHYLFIMSLSLSLLYLLHTYRSAIQGLGNTLAPTLSGLVEFFMRIIVPLSLPRLIGEKGLFFAEPAAWGGAAILLITAYYLEIRRLDKKAVRTGLHINGTI